MIVALLSRRVRSWLLLAVAVPTARYVLRRASSSLRSRRGDTRPVRALATADRELARLDRRKQRRV